MTQRQVKQIEAKRFGLMAQMLGDQLTSMDRKELGQELARTERQLDQAAQEYVFGTDERWERQDFNALMKRTGNI